MAGTGRDIVIFDLGGVVIEWDPRHLYRKLFAGDDAAMEHFLATVCTHEWNRGQDAGRSFAEGARLLTAQHPDKAELIKAYGARFDEMMPGPITGTVAILAELRERGTPLYALTNFSAETYPPTFARFDFLKWFRAVVVSGEVEAIKPNPKISTCLLTPTPSTRSARCSSTTCRPTLLRRRRSAFTASALRRPKRCATSLSGSGCSHSSEVDSTPTLAIRESDRTANF